MTREDRLAEIVTRYFQARERGAAPDPDVLIAEHPDLADDLRSFFAAQSHVAKAAQSFKAAYDPNQPTIGADGAAVPETIRYFGDYEVLAEIARGGMGVVYKARQVSLNRTVALKMILAGRLASATDVQRFRAEAEAAAGLDHPNILPIYEVGEHQGQQYFTMKLVAGRNLAAKLPELRNDLSQALDLFIAVGEAVTFAHQRGILHRDLKPANILIDADGTPYVTDFGLAKKVGGDGGLTNTGAILGTPSYMSPEQARGEKTLTTGADIYALGAILYELIAGRPPFRADSPLDTVLQVIERDPPDPRSLNLNANRDLSVIALKCLAKDPARRYPTVAALVDDLGRVRRGEPIAARPVGRVERLKMWARRNPKLAASLAGTYVALLVGVIALVYGLRMSERSADAKQKLYEQSVAQEQEATRLNGLVSESLGAEKQTAYFTQVNLAFNEWQLNNPARADRLLDGCEPAQRAWEWAFLRRLMHPERAALTADARGLAVLTYSPDGKRLVTTGVDERIRLWDLTTGKHLLTLAGHTDLIRGIAFTPDGKRLVSSSAKETLAWDMETGKAAPWTGPTGGAKGIDINAKGQVAVLLKGKQVAAYAADSDKPLFTVPGESVAWDSQGRFLATTVGSEVVLRDPATGAEQGRLTAEGKPLAGLVVSGDGRRVAAASEDRQYAWDVPAKKLVLSIRGQGFDAAMSRDGRRLAVGGQREVRFWNLDTGDELPRLRGLGGYILNLAFAPDGRSFAAATGDFLISALKKEDPDSPGVLLALAFGASMENQPVDLRIWDAPVPEFGVALAADDRPIKAFAVGPNGLLAVGRDKAIELWSIPERRLRRSITVSEGDADALAISPDGGTLISGGAGREVRVWDTATGATRKPRMKTGKAVTDLAAFPDGRTVAVAAGSSNSVVMWDYRTGEEKAVSFADSTGSTHLAIGHREPILVRSSTGGFYINNDDTRRDAGRAVVVDARTGLKVRDLDPPHGLVRALVLSPDDRTVAVLSGTQLAAGTLQFLNVATGKELAQFPGDSEIPTALAFTPDGRRLVVGTDASLKFWDVATGKLILTVPGGTGRFQFTPDGATLVVQRDRGLSIFETTPPPALQPLPVDTAAGGDPPLPTDNPPDCFPKPVRDLLTKAEERLKRQDLAGAALYTVRAAEVDATADPARLDVHRRSVSLYRQALSRLGDAGPSAAQTPLVPEKPLDRQMRSVFGPDGESVVFFPMAFTAPPHAVRRFDIRSAHELGGRILINGKFYSEALRPVVPTADGKRVVLQPSRLGNKVNERWIDTVDLATGQAAGPRIDVSAAAGDPRVHGRKIMSVTGDGRYAVLNLVVRAADVPGGGDVDRSRAWDLTTGKELTLPTEYHRLSFSPDGRYVLAAWVPVLAPGRPPLTNVVYDLDTMKPVGQPIPLPKSVGQLLLSRDAKYAIATTETGDVTLRVFEVATGQCTLARTYKNNRMAFAVSPAGDRVAIQRSASNAAGCFEVRYTANGRLDQTGTTLVDHLSRLRFSPDGRFVVATLWGGQRQVVDTELTEPIGPPLPCDGSGADDRLTDDPDATFVGGETVLTRAPWPPERYLTQTHFYRWDLRAVPLDFAAERARIELVAGRVVTATGELAAIPADEYRRRWTEAKAAHPDWFAPTAPAEPPVVPTSPAGDSLAKPPRPETNPDYSSIFSRHGGADRPPLVSMADALSGPAPAARTAALDYLAFTRSDDRLTLDLLAEGLKDSAIRGEVETRFEQLGAKAAPVVAALVAELATQWAHGNPDRTLIRTLGRIGTPARDAVPVLRKYLASVRPNHYSDVETEGVRALGRIGPDARAALPELIARIGKYHVDPERAVLVRAFERIFAGREADAVPLLTKMLGRPAKEPDYDRATPRERCCEFVAHLGPKLAGIEPALRALLAEPLPKNPDAHNFERVFALEALWRVTGRADDVVPLLDAELKREYGSYPTHSVSARGRAAAAAGRIGEPARMLLPTLEAALRQSVTVPDRVALSEAIWRLGGKPDGFLAAAKAQLAETTAYIGVEEDKARVIRTLGEVGPPARELVPILLDLGRAERDAEAKRGISFTIVRTDEEDPDPNLRGKLLPAIREALDKIDPAALPKLEAGPKN
jgi:eukaryotic-like serine/threonine-protein kinase